MHGEEPKKAAAVGGHLLARGRLPAETARRKKIDPRLNAMGCEGPIKEREWM